MDNRRFDNRPPTATASRDASAAQRELIRSFEALFDDETLTKAVLLDALERKSDGVMLLGAAGEIAFLNATAEAILHEADGLTFTDGRFATARLPETRRLHDCIANVNAGKGEGGDVRNARVLVSRPSGKAPYIVCIMPAPASSATLSSRCVVHIVDLSAHAPLSKEVACATFGLSEREGDLAVELTRCNGLKAAAERAGMALNTARNHMRSVFSKCHVHSQMELSRILARLT